MTEAVFGLIGVIIGGLISGGATYVMARRLERRRARAAVRLVEEELRNASTLAESVVKPVFDESFVGHPELVQVLRDSASNLPSPNAWEAHKGELAELLDDKTWSTLADGYEALQAFRQLNWTEVLLDDGRLIHSAVGDTLRELLGQLSRASVRMTEIAGRTPSKSALRAYFVREKAGPNQAPADY